MPADWTSLTRPGDGASNLVFLNEFKRLDVGFAFKKGSRLAPAFQGPVRLEDRCLPQGGSAQRV